MTVLRVSIVLNFLLFSFLVFDPSPFWRACFQSRSYCDGNDNDNDDEKEKVLTNRYVGR
jgi:hypothetical protein